MAQTMPECTYCFKRSVGVNRHRYGKKNGIAITDAINMASAAPFRTRISPTQTMWTYPVCNDHKEGR